MGDRMRRELYQEILLEIALSISGEFDLDKLLKKCLPLFQRKLNCLFSGVYSETEGALDLERVLPTAIRSSDRYRWAHAELLRVHAEGNTESLVVISHDGVHLYLMNLLGFGRLLLCRATAFDPYFLKELLPLAPMLARACTSCQELARRREIEASLEKERQLTTAIIDHAPIGIWLTDYHDRSLLLVNPFMKKEVGLGTDDNRMSHEEMDVCAETDHQAVAAEGSVECDERITFKDGRQHTLKTIKTKIRDDDGSITAILGLGVDITDAIKAQREAQRQSRLQQLLMEIASTYINLPLDRVDDAINASLRDLALFVDADRAYIFDYDFTVRVSSNLFEWCNSGIQPQIASLQQVPMVEFPDWLHVHLQGKPMYVADVGALPPGGLRNILEPQGNRACWPCR